MIFPTTYLASLLLLCLTLICWGTWANTQKALAKQKWRFELFYFDFMIGAVLTMVVAAYTVGSLNSQELTFQDNLLITGYRKMAFSIAAGMAFSLGNFLLVAAVALAGMAVGFPLAFATAAVGGVIFTYVTDPKTNPMLTFGGAVFFLVSMVLTAFAHLSESDTLAMAENKPLRPDPRVKGASRSRVGGARALVLAILGGILIALSRPPIQWAREGENGIAPYGIAILFAAGVLVGTLVSVPFFVNFPASGHPVQTRTYFKGTRMQHLAGWFSGIVWSVGALALWVTAAAPSSVQAGQALTYAFSEGSAVVAGLMGLLLWKDLSHGPRAKLFGLVGIGLLAVGIGMVTTAYVIK
jgi:glucose uptake protein